MALRIKGRVYSTREEDFDIEIYDDDYVGSPVDVSLQRSYSLDLQSTDQERFSPIFGSKVTVPLVVGNSVFITIINGFVADLINANESRFTLVIKKNTTRFFVGKILTDAFVKQDDKDPYIVEITATDGIGKLKDIPYSNDGNEYTGKETIIQHLYNCIDKIGVASFHDTGYYIQAICNWYDQNMPYEVTSVQQSPLTRSRLNNRLFKEVSSNGQLTFKSCYDVILEICKTIGARFLYSAGSFWIIQVNEYKNDTVTVFQYEDTIGVPNVASLDITKTMDTDIIRQAGATFSYFPPLNKIDVVYNHFSTNNMIPGAVWIGSALRSGEDIDHNGGLTRLLCSFDLQYQITFDPASGFEENRAKFRILIQVGSYYLSRPATVGNNVQPIYGEMEWTTTLSYYEWVGTPAFSNGKEFLRTISIFTPPVQESGSLSVNFELQAVYDTSGNTINSFIFASTYIVDNSYIEPIVNGVIKDQYIKKVQTTTNDTEGNSKSLEVQTIIGDGPTGNAYGHIEVLDATDTWVLSTGWRVGNSGAYKDISSLLASEIITGQLKSVERWRATVVGFYEPHLKIIRDDFDFVPLQLTFDAARDSWAGEWFHIVGGIGSTDLTPVDISKDPIRPSVPSVLPDPDAPTETAQPAKDKILNQLTPLTYGGTGIGSGDTVTTIELNETLSQYDVVKDDIIQIIDLNTGNSQNFTVSATPSAGATSVSVTSATASYDFVTGSFIKFDETQKQNQLNTSIAKLLPLQDYQVDALYHLFAIINMTQLTFQARDDAASPTAVATLSMLMDYVAIIYQKGGKNVGFGLDDDTGAFLYYDNGTNLTELRVKDGGLKITNLPEYADHAAADADSGLFSDDIYKLTGDRTLYQKP